MQTFRVNTSNNIVNPTDGVLSLREAIANAAASPGTDTIILGTSSSIVLTSALPTMRSSNNLNIIGGMGNRLSTISGDNQHQIFNIDGADVRLENLTLTKGHTISAD